MWHHEWLPASELAIQPKACDPTLALSAASGEGERRLERCNVAAVRFVRRYFAAHLPEQARNRGWRHLEVFREARRGDFEVAELEREHEQV